MAAPAFVQDQLDALASLWANKRVFAYHFLKLLMIILSALMIWKGAMVYTNSESPVVVVLSGSMEPAFQRGDILFLMNNYDEPIRVGEIVVFKIAGRDIPIVHRVVRVHEHAAGEGDDASRTPEERAEHKERMLALAGGVDPGPDIDYLTKGDNNSVDDRGLYHEDQLWLKRDQILGRARGCLPYVGMVTVLLNDYPWAKFVLVGVMGLFVLTSRE